MKLTGLYFWSSRVEIEVPDDTPIEEQRAALDDAAMKAELDFRHPVLHECSNKALVD